MKPDSPQFQLGGGVKPGGAYVPRAADEELWPALEKKGRCLVLGPNQIGKTSLRHSSTAADRRQTLNVDLNAFTSSATEPRAFYFDLFRTIAIELGVAASDPTWITAPYDGIEGWFRRLGALPRSGRPVLFIDEINAIGSLSWSVVETACLFETIGRLRVLFDVCILGTLDPQDFAVSGRSILDEAEAERLSLHDFTRDEMNAFLPPLEGVDEPQNVLDKVYAWTLGHPYLTQRLCAELKEEIAFSESHVDIDAIVDSCFFDSPTKYLDDLALGSTAIRLHNSLNAARGPELASLYRKVLAGGTAEYDPNLANRLWFAGAAGVRDGKLVIRNRLVQRAFGEDWLRQALAPSQEQ